MGTNSKKVISRKTGGNKKSTQKIARSKVKSSRKDKVPKNKRKSKTAVIRGKEVSIRESAAAAQIVYGEMKIGGVVTYVDTSNNSNAYTITGDSVNENELVWTSKFPGVYGNQFFVEIICTGTHPTLDVSVVSDTIIRVRVVSTVGASQSTASQVAAAVNANFDASYRLRCQRLNKTVNGFVDASTIQQLTYGGGTWLHQYITLAAHQIESIEKLYLNNEEVTFGGTPDPRWGSGKWTEKVFMATAYGYGNQEVQPDLNHQKPSTWTTDHRQRGCAGCYLILIWDQNLFPEGYPEITFKIKGKLIYDPRLGGVGTPRVFSRNAALILCDFLTTSVFEGGYGISYFNINEAALIEAANICDQDVSISAGGTEKRYCIDGVYTTDDSREDILKQMLAAMGGDLVIEAGYYYIYPAAYREPVITYTENDIRDSIVIKTHVSRSDSFNAVRGTFVSPEHNYSESDVPEVKSSFYITEDGGVKIYEDIALNFVTQKAQAQRLFKIELERIRQGVSITFRANLTALRSRVSDVVRLTIDQYGYDEKLFEVLECNIILENDLAIGVDLELKETASGIYTFSPSEEVNYDIAPNTNLPDSRDVIPPTAFTAASGTAYLYIRTDGSVQPRVFLQWVAPQNPYVIYGGSYELQYKRSAESIWQQVAILQSNINTQYVTDVEDGVDYDFRIRSVNTINATSTWVTILNHTVIGKLAPPSNVSNFAVVKQNFGVNFTWDDITDLDKDQYEIRYGASWGVSTLVTRVKARSYTWNYIPAGTYEFRIKSIDTSGNYSLTDTLTSITIGIPSTPNVSSTILSERLKLSWTESTSDFAIKEYEIRVGANLLTSTLLATVTALNFELRIDWLGVKKFFVAARDVALNLSSFGEVTVDILAPNAVDALTSNSVSNTVLIDWEQPVLTSLPIQKYYIYKGDTFGGAEYLGSVSGTFQTYIERSTGTFTYWVVAEDTAGNLSTEESTVINIVAPTDYFVLAEQELYTNLINSSLALIGGGANAPFEDEKTFWTPVTDQTQSISAWFTANGWTTVQDAITAGFNQWLMPGSTSSGYLEFKVDYGGVFSSSYIELMYDEVSMVGTVTYTDDISVSLDDSSYTTYTGVSQVFASNFRYVKYKINFTAANTNSLSRLNNIRSKLSLKIEEESGTVTCVSSDSGGTTVTFVKAFLDVEEIQATPNGTTAQFPVVNFVDIPNPTTFKVLLFNDSGTRINGSVFYKVRGAINP